MTDFIIISCAFGKRYLEQLDRLGGECKGDISTFPYDDMAQRAGAR